MSLVIRLSKVGRRGEKKYRIVVKEQRDKRDGKTLDALGYYEQKDKNKSVKNINQKKISYWISRGAQLSSKVLKII